MRAIGRSLHAWVVPAQVSIGDSAEVFNLSGEPIIPEIGDRLKEVGRQVAHFARLHKCENHAQFVKEWEVHPTSKQRRGQAEEVTLTYLIRVTVKYTVST